MAMTYDQRQKAKRDRFLATLTADAEVFGILGEGYPNSVYRIFVRAKPSGKWWRVQETAQATDLDPIKRQSQLPVKSRAAAWWGPLTSFAAVDFMPGRTAIGDVKRRATEVGEKGRA